MKRSRTFTFVSGALARHARGTQTDVASRAPQRRRHTRSAMRRPSARRRRLVAAAALLTLSVLGAACGGATGKDASASSTLVVPAAQVSITPANGARDVLPSRTITVNVTGGKIVRVTVKTSGDAVSGTLNAGATAWHGRGLLDVATRYRVRATALDAAGRTVTKTSTFRTLNPSETFDAEIFEGQGQSYGVGMPIILTFDRAITDRRAVERSLELWTSRRVVGAGIRTAIAPSTFGRAATGRRTPGCASWRA